MTPTADARAALFDVDGTLVDTNYLHVVTWWEAFRQAGHAVAMPDIHHTIGMGSDHLLDRSVRDRRPIGAIQLGIVVDPERELEFADLGAPAARP